MAAETVTWTWTWRAALVIEAAKKSVNVEADVNVNVTATVTVIVSADPTRSPMEVVLVLLPCSATTMVVKAIAAAVSCVGLVNEGWFR